ncbi:MAG: hypothetical protein ACTSRG_14820 [Candidatus Helarchaeota archaeon]
MVLILPIIIGDAIATILGFLTGPTNSGYIIFLYCIISVIEWVFFLYVWTRLRNSGVSIKEVFKRSSGSVKALLLYGTVFFLIINGMVVLSNIYYLTIYPYQIKLPMNAFNLILLEIITPITAGICEETI